MQIYVTGLNYSLHAQQCSLTTPDFAQLPLKQSLLFFQLSMPDSEMLKFCLQYKNGIKNSHQLQHIITYADYWPVYNCHPDVLPVYY